MILQAAHIPYIAGAYGVTVVALVGLVVFSLRARRRLSDRLAHLRSDTSADRRTGST